MRVKFTAKDGSYSGNTKVYVSEPMNDETARLVAQALSGSHPIAKKTIGGYEGSENVLVMDQSESASVELVADEVALTLREFANAEAQYAEDKAKKAAKKAADAKAAAELVPA